MKFYSVTAWSLEDAKEGPTVWPDAFESSGEAIEAICHEWAEMIAEEDNEDDYNECLQDFLSQIEVREASATTGHVEVDYDSFQWIITPHEIKRG